MKIVYVDAALDGHHGRYIEGLCKAEGIEKVLIVPHCALGAERDGIKTYRYDFNAKKFNLFNYLKWIGFVRKIFKKEKADAVHFLDGDTIMKFMAVGFGGFRKKLFVTYHNFYAGKLRKICYKRVSRFSRAVIVHTDYAKRLMRAAGVGNVVKNEYPSFDGERLKLVDKRACKTCFGLPDDKLAVGFVGGISAYKGFDLFEKALPILGDDACFFVAGKSTDYGKEYLDGLARDNPQKMFIKEGWLTDEDYVKALCAVDVLLLPYRDGFYGASGPLADGVVLKKFVITCGDNSLSDIVSENGLGFVMKERTPELLVECVEKAKGFSYGEKANAYSEKASEETFLQTYNKIYSGELQGL